MVILNQLGCGSLNQLGRGSFEPTWAKVLKQLGDGAQAAVFKVNDLQDNKM